MVHPVPAPISSTAESSSRMKAGTISQKLILFMRGKAMSGAPIMIGTIQLPKPPISAGITTKNTMMRPWAVMNTFHSWPSIWPSGPIRYCAPGSASSMRMTIEKAPPISPAQMANSR